MGGDFDGDKLTILTRMMLDDASYQMLRSGTMLRTSETRGAINIGTSATEVGHISVLQEALNGPDGASKNMAEQAVQRLRVFLTSEVGAPLDAQRYVDEFLADLRRGDAKAKQHLFDNLANHREAQMQEKAGSTWNNEWFRINSRIRREFWTFQQALSEATAGETSAEVQESPYNVVMADSLSGELRARPGATATIQAWLELSGENIFRNWQALNYASNRSNAEQWGEQQRTVFLSMAEHYAALNSGQPTSKIETILSKDNITRNVVRKLERQLEVLQKEPASRFTTLP